MGFTSPLSGCRGTENLSATTFLTSGAPTEHQYAYIIHYVPYEGIVTYIKYIQWISVYIYTVRMYVNVHNQHTVEELHMHTCVLLKTHEHINCNMLTYTSTYTVIHIFMSIWTG